MLPQAPAPHLIRSLRWGQPLHTGKSVRSMRPPREAFRPAGLTGLGEAAEMAGLGGRLKAAASQATRLHDSPSPFCFPADERLVHCGKHKGAARPPPPHHCASARAPGSGGSHSRFARGGATRDSQGSPAGAGAVRARARKSIGCKETLRQP